MEKGRNKFNSGEKKRKGAGEEKRYSRKSRANTASGDKKTGKEEQLRLNKFIANSGLCSRREADELIEQGFITVNGEKITELGAKVNPDDDVRYKNKKLKSEKPVYILLNKPKDVVTTLSDEQNRRTVIDIVKNACPQRVYPVGRLDRNTTGVLLLTNDGELAKRLTHPKYKKRKIYHVVLDKPVVKRHMDDIVEGIELEDGVIAADAISYPEEDDKTQVGIEIHSGQNRVVRRIFEKLGYKIKKLDRVYFAGLTKKNLQRGKWRFLTGKEVHKLKMNAFS